MLTLKSCRQISLVALAFAAVNAGAAGAETAPDAPPVVTKPVIGTITPKANGWAELSFVYVPKFPFDGTPGSALKRPPLGPTSKTIFQSPDGAGTDLPQGQLIHLEYLPTFNSNVPKMGMKPHYHEFWEWGYTLKGDSIMPEPVSPYQANGMFYRKREGGWLTRPPYSLHGGSWATGAMRNQLPYDLIIFEEGDGHVIEVGEPGQPGHYRGRDGGQPPAGTVGDWRKVKRFQRPWLLDSTRDVDWEDDKQVPGRFVKWLDDDMENGFRSQLVKIPPGWTPPKEWLKTYFDDANRFRYMIWGSMKVWQFKNPQDAGKAYTVGEDYFIYQPPRAIWGYGPGSVSDQGAIWLEVTYSKGLKHAGAGPIEEVKRLD
jgi:hypothetical protein